MPNERWLEFVRDDMREKGVSGGESERPTLHGGMCTTKLHGGK